jgi:MFS transporter, NNP family, nitrate/nitrite transporter
MRKRPAADRAQDACLASNAGGECKLRPNRIADRVGSITDVIAAGGLGGFFPPLVMGIVKLATGGTRICA